MGGEKKKKCHLGERENQDSNVDTLYTYTGSSTLDKIYLYPIWSMSLSWEGLKNPNDGFRPLRNGGGYIPDIYHQPQFEAGKFYS